MPTKKVPSLPPLNADLLRLLALNPLSFESLDRFLDLQETNTATGRRKIYCTVSNIFAPPDHATSAPWGYNLLHTSHLADKADRDLLDKEPPDKNWYWSFPVDPAAPPASNAPVDAEGRLRDPSVTPVLDPTVFQRAQEGWDRLVKDHREHSFAVRQVCRQLGELWERAWDQYEKDPKPPFVLPSVGGPWPTLYLRPYVSLPSRDLIHELVNGHHTRHLFLLTARHELGHVYRLVMREHRAFKKAGDPAALADQTSTPDDRWGLTPWHLGLLRDRARGYYGRTWGRGRGGEGYDQTAPTIIDRTDIPVDDYRPDSGLAHLYAELERWYDMVHAQTTALKLCEHCHSNLLPLGRDHYCSAQCAADSRRIKNTEDRRAKRHADKAEALKGKTRA